MCYSKPGPRCAGHLRTQITTLEAREVAAVAGFARGEDVGPEAREVSRLLEQAREEYAETPTARTAEEKRVRAMPKGPERKAATENLTAAEARYEQKKAAHRDVHGNALRSVGAGVSHDDAPREVPERTITCPDCKGRGESRIMGVPCATCMRKKTIQSVG